MKSQNNLFQVSRTSSKRDETLFDNLANGKIVSFEKLISIFEASGKKISKNTIYGWISRRGMPTEKIAGTLFFRLSDVERWLIEEFK